jgi:hypothetical protein
MQLKAAKRYVNATGSEKCADDNVADTQISIIQPRGLRTVDLDPLALACCKKALIKLESGINFHS